MKTSKDPRHQSRRLAFGYIHALENAGIKFDSESLKTIKESAIELLEITQYNEELFEIIVNSYLNDKEKIFDTITKNSKEWQLSEMYRPDIIILIIAICEIQTKKVPIKVAIDEAVELAKEFCDAESTKFINGVLAGIVQDFLNTNNEQPKES
jgi:transcription antitermination protein NusB